MSAPLPPQIPQLPSRRMGAVLAALMLAAGIALGALIGPGPAASLESTSRAAALGRALALMALGSGTGAGGELLLSSGAAHPPASGAPQPTPAASSQATQATTGTGNGNGAAGKRPGTSPSAPSTASPSAPSSGSVSPTSSTTPAVGGGGGEKTHKPTPLPPIAHVWLIVLPYGASLGNALGQSTAAPYLDGQLTGMGTVLNDYPSLAAGELAGAATLLSGQVGASVSAIAPPPCGAIAAPGTATAGAGPGTAPSPGASAGRAGTGASPGIAASPGAPAGQAATSLPCPAGEPASLQAGDAFLHEVVPKIMASASYTEHGLIVITFGAANQEGASPAATTTPSAGATEAGSPGIAYPEGSLTSTLTAAGSPAGALLLSPFLRHAGTRISSTFNALSPRASLQAIFQAKASS